MNHSPASRVAEGRIGALFDDPRQAELLLAVDPGLHNVLGNERAFAAEPRVMDFLDPASPFFHLKQLSARLYLDFFASTLDALPRETQALDVGCGVGRFTLPLAKRFAQVTAVDASPSALDACERHAREAGLGNVDLHWADLSWLDELPASSFDLICAVELLCYTAEALAVARRLARVAKPDARLLVAVEAQPGALCGQAMEPERLAAVLRGEPLLQRHDRWVRYYDRGALTELLTGCGWRITDLAGSHYLAEGPLWQAMDDRRLDDPAYVERIIAVEKICREHPLARDLARVLCAVGRKA
jgi:2-polyprenyl-3-methyl-5-hydroxy-6-metoxy-1,4-benzoquinol methylase